MIALISCSEKRYKLYFRNNIVPPNCWPGRPSVQHSSWRESKVVILLAATLDLHNKVLIFMDCSEKVFVHLKGLEMGRKGLLLVTLAAHDNALKLSYLTLTSLLLQTSLTYYNQLVNRPTQL